jgi:hypothetical protein
MFFFPVGGSYYKTKVNLSTHCFHVRDGESVRSEIAKNLIVEKFLFHGIVQIDVFVLKVNLKIDLQRVHKNFSTALIYTVKLGYNEQPGTGHFCSL